MFLEIENLHKQNKKKQQKMEIAPRGLRNK